MREVKNIYFIAFLSNLYVFVQSAYTYCTSLIATIELF